jgi:hypothetical protein
MLDTDGVSWGLQAEWKTANARLHRLAGSLIVIRLGN